MLGPGTIAECLWVILGVYWLVAALSTKKVALNESAGLRLLRLAVLVVVLALLLTEWFNRGFLGQRFVARIAVLEWFGVAVTACGASIAIWARSTLGSNWSDKVVLKVDHQLIRSGPYRYLRHPIYTGVLLAMVGTTLTNGRWRCVVALAVLSVNYFIKAKREEKILSARFGDAFAEHKRNTGFFLPGM